MATNVLAIQNLVNDYILDTTTNSVTNAARLRAISEAVKSLYNDFEFDFTNKRYQLDYFDRVNFYDITSSVKGFAEPVDLRREEGKHLDYFTRKSPREMAVEITEGVSEKGFAIEKRDRANWVSINYKSENEATVIHNCDSTTQVSEIEVDTTNSDALLLTIDHGEFKEGTGSVNFDLDIDQSANQRMTVMYNLTTTLDMSKEEDLSSQIFWAYLPAVSGDSSSVMVGYWGQNSSNYWSGIVEKDINGNDFVSGWNRVKVNWAEAAKTGSPDSSKIAWARIDINHNASADNTDYRIDEVLMVKPERLYLHYQSWFVGVASTSSVEEFFEFYNVNNIPFYSGLYDFFDVYVAHKAAAILFRQMGLMTEADREELIATREQTNLKRKFPSTRLSTTKNLKVAGLNFNK